MLLEILIVYFQYINPNLCTEEFKISLPSNYLWYKIFSVILSVHKYLIVNDIDMASVFFFNVDCVFRRHDALYLQLFNKTLPV